MERKDKHKHDHRHDDNADQIAESLETRQRNQERRNTWYSNRLWLWLGVLVLVALLLWWIFSIGFVEDTTGFTNFGN